MIILGAQVVGRAFSQALRQEYQGLQQPVQGGPYPLISADLLE